MESSKRFGMYSWVERRMFQILGAWAADGSKPRLTVMFDDHSRRHWWHSTIWFDRLPELANVDADGLVRTPSPELAALLDEVAEMTDTLERLTVGYQVVVTQLEATYRDELNRLDRVGNASARHWLGFILQNLSEELAEAQSELDRAIRDDDDRARISAIRLNFEERFLALGSSDAFAPE
ncbi:MAG: hypothetical protein WBA45_12205 [Microthrixaceae bacterium]